MNRQNPKPRLLDLIGTIALFAVIAATAFAVPACHSAQTDPATDVSVGSYRAALTKIQSNLDVNVAPAIAELRDLDLSSPTPRHLAAWWDQKLGLVKDTSALAADTLAGKNVGAAPAAPAPAPAPSPGK